MFGVDLKTLELLFSELQRDYIAIIDFDETYFYRFQVIFRYFFFLCDQKTVENI